MIKRILVLATVLLFLMSSALGETWSGTVISTLEKPVLAAASGILEELNLSVGQTVSSGDIVGHTSVTSVFASESGTVSLVKAKVGEIVSDTVLEISPVSKYRIVSATTDAYSSPETSIIHGGETLFIRCTADRSHLAIGFTANLSGSNFDVFTTAGELYIGETVNLYRSQDYAYESKVGVGTVVENDLVQYKANGHLISISVEEGSRVERGQLLFTYASSASTEITIPEDGIITDIQANAGQSVQQDQVLATLAVPNSIRIEFSAAENMIYLLNPGDTLSYLRADDPTDTPRKATISGISRTANGDTYTVYLIPEENDLPIGMSITVVNETMHSF